jgi:Tol biopolymer transport system component
VRIDGSGLERVSADCALNPVWAPDSRRIAFVRHWGINYQSGIVTVAGLRGERRDVGLWEAGPQDLAWAPDGSRLAYATAAEREPRNAHGQSSGGPAELSPSETRIVLPEGSLVAEIPRGSAAVWSPAGRRLAYIALSRALPGQPRPSLFTAAADGSRPRRLADHGRLAQPQAWSPDGQAIAYVGTEAEQIWLSTGGRPRLLTHLKPGGVIESVWWTPDARRVLFTWEFTAID